MDEGSARRRDLYLTTHNTHKRQTSTPQVEFEPAIPPSGRTQVHAFVREATGIGLFNLLSTKSQEISNLTAQCPVTDVTGHSSQHITTRHAATIPNCNSEINVTFL